MTEDYRYSVHTWENYFCTEKGEFKTLEEANKRFDELVSKIIEKKDSIHPRMHIRVYMLDWTKDLSGWTEIRCWSNWNGYEKEIPNKPISIIDKIKRLFKE